MAGMITDATDDELAQYAAAIRQEQDRRRTLATAQKQMADLSMAYLSAAGVRPGDPWVQPAGAHDAYPEGWEVSHGGTTWVSTTPANVWEPGVSGWREKVEEGAAPPEWVAPTGAHDAYSLGDLVTYQGGTYRSLMDGNVWSPTDNPAGWERTDG